MKYFIITGERSGDLHGSNLIRALKKEDPEAQICAWGGDQMKTAGADLKNALPRSSIYGLFGSFGQYFQNSRIHKAM